MIEILNNGKLICEIIVIDILFVVRYFYYFVSVIEIEEGIVNDIDKDIMSIVWYELIGVVGVVVVWNFLMLLVVWKIVLVIVVGNIIVI